MIKKLIVTTLILISCLFPLCLAQEGIQIVETTGNVNLRTKPSLSGTVIDSVPAHKELEYRGQVSRDDRGVDWYAVWYGNEAVWISSKYATLFPVQEESGIPRHQLLEQLGVLSPKDTVNIQNYSVKRSGDNINLHIVFDDDVYYGGTEGYYEAWLTGEGVASEIDVDLDGDGIKELLLLYCSQIDSRYAITQNWKGLIYEPVGHGYVKAAEIPLDILTDGTCERSVSLLKQDSHTVVAVIRDDEWDGTGGMAIRVALFDYDGDNVSIPLLANVGFTCGSFVVVGPFSMDWLRQLDRGDLFYGTIDPNTTQGLKEGENFFYYDGIDSVEYKEDVGAQIRQETLDNFRDMANRIKPYGIAIDYKVNSEQYDLQVEKGSMDLLWAKETCPYPKPSYIDITLHTKLDHQLE